MIVIPSVARMEEIIMRHANIFNAELVARGQTGKRRENNDEVESPISSHRRKQRKMSMSSGSDTIIDEDGGYNHASTKDNDYLLLMHDYHCLPKRL